MITLIPENYNSINPNEYKNLVDNLNLLIIPCSCGQYGTLIRHSYYKRTLVTESGPLEYVILRVRCKHCNKTHAVLTYNMVPYMQLSLSAQKDMITHTIHDSESVVYSNPDNIDESRYYRVIRRFKKYWKSKLIAMSINLKNLINLSIKDLCLLTFECFRCQFMQIRRGTNICFQLTT